MNELTPPVGADDHARGPEDAPITLVEYGDFECPYCRQAYEELKAVLETGRVRLVFRHFPISEIHARAEQAAVAAEAAARQGRFWEMHDRLFEHQDRLGDNDLLEHARVLGLDLDAFKADVGDVFVPGAADPELRRRVREARAGGEASGATGTPAFFVNGRGPEREWRRLFQSIVRREGVEHVR